MIQHTIHHLSFEQIQFLNRGPTYILPGQMHLFHPNQTLNEVLAQQHLPLRKQLLQIFTKFSLDLARQQIFRRAIEQQFLESFSLSSSSSSSSSIPIHIQQRAFHEQKLLRSIQLQLKEDHVILRRTADDYNTFYLCDRDSFNRMTQDHIETNTYFEMIGSIDSTVLNSEQQHLTRIIQSMDAILQGFVQRKLLPIDYFKKLQLTKKTNLTLPYLYFLPIIHQNGHVQLQARLSSCKNAPVRVITTFLDRLLRSLFENCSQATTFLDGHDFIQKLQQYCLQADCLTLNTEFVTFKLHNLYTHLSHTDLLMALNQFLVQRLAGNRYQWLSIIAIEELTQFALQHHIFTYQGKIYRYIKGSPMNYAFTQLLFDIYLHNWQTILVRHIRVTNQFYGRYHDRGIFTWNKFNNDLHICIKELNEQNTDIQLTTSIGRQVHFLQAYIENQKGGTLYTRVYQDSSMRQQQLFLLPYTAEHPRILHRQWFRFSLARAIQYCPLFNDFQEQRLQIELTFLANGYSLDFVHYHLKQFFKRFNPFNYIFIHNQLNYHILRQQVFRYYNQRKLDLKQERERQQQLFTVPHSISFYYLFDWGNRIEFNRKFHELWSAIITKDSKFAHSDFKVFLRCKHCYLLHTLLVQYK